MVMYQKPSTSFVLRDFLISKLFVSQIKISPIQMPQFPRKLDDYWHRDSFLAVVGFMMGVRLLSLLPIGAKATSSSGNEIRLNGFYTLLTVLAVVPALVYRKVDVSFATKNYFYLMTSALILAAIFSKVAYILVSFHS